MMTETTMLLPKMTANGGPYSKPPSESTLLHDHSVDHQYKYMSCNMNYFQRASGVLTLITLAIGLLCLSCQTPDYTPPGTHFFLLIVVVSLVNSLAWCLLRLFNMCESCNKCIANYSTTTALLELINNVFIAYIYFIGICVQFTVWSAAPALGTPSVQVYNLTGGVFGLLNTVVYAALSCVLYGEWKHVRREGNHQLIT